MNPTSPDRSRFPGREAILSGCLIALGALIPLLRVLPSFRSSLPALEASDAFKHVWSLWHTVETLRQGTFPRTELLGAPFGGLLVDVMAIPALLLAPLSSLLGIVAAMNVWIFLSLLALGLICARLAKELGANAVGATLVGLLVQLDPFLRGHALYSGVYERLQAWYLPLLALALLRLWRGGSRLWIPVLFLATLWNGLGSTVYILFGALLLPLLAGVGLAVLHGRQGLNSLLDARRLFGLVLGLAAMLLGALLAWKILLVAHQAPDVLMHTQTNRLHAVGHPEGHWRGADLAEILNPFHVRALTAKIGDDALFETCYLGILPLLLSLAGAIRACFARERAWAGVFGIGLVFLLLAAGPTLAWEGHGPPNPFFLLPASLLHVYGSSPAPYQQIVVTGTLGLLPIAALFRHSRRQTLLRDADAASGAPSPNPHLQGANSGSSPPLPCLRAAHDGSVACWQEGSTPFHRWLLGALLLGAVCLEYALALPFPLIPPPMDCRIPAIYQDLPGSGPVAEAPRHAGGGKPLDGMLLLAQTLHHRPLPITINLGLVSWDEMPELVAGEGDWADVSACLQARGFTALILRRSGYARKQDAAGHVGHLERLLGRAVADDGDRVVFSLEYPAMTLTPSGRCPTGLAPVTPFKMRP